MFGVPANDGFEVVPNLVEHDFTACPQHLFRDRVRVLPKAGQLREQLLRYTATGTMWITPSFS